MVSYPNLGANQHILTAKQLNRLIATHSQIDLYDRFQNKTTVAAPVKWA